MSAGEAPADWRHFSAVLAAYGDMRSYLLAAAERAGVPAARRDALEVGVEEALANVIRHAYPADAPGEVWLRAGTEGGAFFVEVADFGVPFDATRHEEASQEGIPVEEREPGGLGILLLRRTFARMEYARAPFRGRMANRLRLVFSLAGREGMER